MFNLFNMPKKSSIKKPEPQYYYLGIPKNENDWIRYRGGCQIFAGKTLEDDVWLMESEDETKTKLTNALERKGIRCENIKFSHENVSTGERICDVICSYNKPYRIHHDDFYLEGITTFDFEYLERDPSQWQVEFCLYEVLN